MYLDEFPGLTAYGTVRMWLTSENDLVHSPDPGSRRPLTIPRFWTIGVWQEFLTSILDYGHLAGYPESFQHIL